MWQEPVFQCILCQSEHHATPANPSLFQQCDFQSLRHNVFWHKDLEEEIWRQSHTLRIQANGTRNFGILQQKTGGEFESKFQNHLLYLDLRQVLPGDSDCRVNSVPARQFGEIADFLSELQIPHHNCRAQIEDRKALVFQDIDTYRKLKLYFIKSSALNFMKLWFYSFGLFNQLLKQVKIYHE